jgi:membrane-associated phospholipid phosphatase
VLLARLVLLAAGVILLQQAQKTPSLELRFLLPVVLLALLATFARNWRDIRLWALYLAGFMAFVQLRTYADETGMPHFVSYPIALDRLMFLGAVPTAWLQERFHEPGNARIYEVLLAVVYFTYFFVPHVAAIVVWRRKPALFPRVMAAILVTFHIGLIGYFLVPTVPPWLAPEMGHGPEMLRIIPTLSSQVDADTYENASRAVGQNDVGAMPSLHMALTVLVALVMADSGRAWKLAGRTYACLMGLALIYLGEHYLVDVLAGTVLALGVWKLSAVGFRAGALFQGQTWRMPGRPLQPEPAYAAEVEAPERVA